MKRVFFLFAVIQLSIASTLYAQSVEEQLWRSMIEEWAELNDSESVPDEIVEDLQSFIDNPINLNDTASELLTSLPFINDLQRDIIKAYIAQNGQLVSLAELHLMNGFDTLQIKLLSIFATVEPIDDNTIPTPMTMVRHGRSNLRMGIKTVFPRSRAYYEKKYLGSPFREYFRYKFHYSNRLAFQLSADKDAGDPFRFASDEDKAPMLGFDYYGYHLMVNEMGIVKSAIIGKYQLQFGQGATLWSGFAPWGGYDMPLRRYGQGIRATSAFCEYGYLRGTAATISLIPKRLEATVFYSYVKRDATADTTDDGAVFFTSLYNSGYHRSENESMKKWRLDEHLTGTHIQYHRPTLNIGATAYGTFFSDKINPVKNVYNAFAFRGNRLFNVGVDASWRYRRTILFGEVATSIEEASYMPTGAPLPLAAVAGMETNFSSDNSLSVAYRHGTPSYHNFFANTIGQSSSPQNDAGVITNLRLRLPFNTRLAASADLFRNPWMRYRLYAPSSGVDYRVKLSKDLTQNTQIVAQYQYRVADRNSDLQTYAVETTIRQRLSLHLEYSKDGWRLLSRLVLARFNCTDHSPEHGFLMLQDISRTTSFLGKDLTINARTAIFDVTGYDARIYSSESDLMYEFSAPMLMYRGMRSYLVVRYDLSNDISVALKYAVSYYPEQETLGSGYDTTTGSCRHELKAQLRLRF